MAKPGGGGAGPGRSSYVLVLREHDEQGSGYSLELAPLAASDAPPRARGRAPAGEGEVAATATGGHMYESSARSGSGEEGNGEEAAGGALSRRSSRDTAATATGTARRARGGLAREETGDGVRGGSDAEDCVDVAADEGDRILRDMRRLIFSQTAQDTSNIADANKNLIKVREREILVPVFLSPKKGKNKKDDLWDKRQIMYGIALVGLLAFVPAIVAFLLQWALFVFAVVWGVSSIGFPLGLYGTSKLETSYSRHMGRFVFMGFCLVVIFMLYQYMAIIGNSPEAISPSPSEATHSSARVDTKWTAAFTFVGVAVMAGHIFSWARGCLTGSDDDEESESSGTEDMRGSDLLQRLLERH